MERIRTCTASSIVFWLSVAGSLATSRVPPGTFRSADGVQARLGASHPEAGYVATVSVNAESDVSGGTWNVRAFTRARSVGTCAEASAEDAGLTPDSIVTLTVAPSPGSASTRDIVVHPGAAIGEHAFEQPLRIDTVDCTTKTSCVVRYDVTVALSAADGGTAPSCAEYEIDLSVSGAVDFSQAPRAAAISVMLDARADAGQ